MLVYSFYSQLFVFYSVLCVWEGGGLHEFVYVCIQLYTIVCACLMRQHQYSFCIIPLESESLTVI